MQPVESYVSEIVAAIRPLLPAELSLEQAEGAVTAADVTAAWQLPGFDNSGMDGYAVRAADVATASASTPVVLTVEAEVAAGDTTSRTLTPGRCIKIMTGALLPAGADAVVHLRIAGPAGCDEDHVGSPLAGASHRPAALPAPGRTRDEQDRSHQNSIPG